MPDAFHSAVSLFPFWPPAFIPATVDWLDTTPSPIDEADLTSLMNKVTDNEKCPFPLDWIQRHSLT
jgi:hypothetical protein